MPGVGQIEKATQARVVALLRDRLGYDYLGDWTHRTGNACIEAGLLAAWLRGRGVTETLIGRALFELTRAAGDSAKPLYDRNREVYELLRYGVKVRPEAGENTVTVWLIDWAQPDDNHFAVAEEVTVKGAGLASSATAARAATKRPDVVLYVNGIALGVLELKRSTVSVAEGIRQNLDNQQKAFIEPFFATLQWLMAGNDTEGLRYGAIDTSAKYWMNWVEDGGAHAGESNLLDRQLLQVCGKARLLELVHDFVVFDAGVKKLCRQNQYFGVKVAQDFVRRREGGIVWHTQGSGKSLTMVWLAKWILGNRPGARVLIVTDRTELDEQIEKVFIGVRETIVRTTSGADLVKQLNAPDATLLCSLVHKFGGKDESDEGAGGEAVKAFTEALKTLPPGFVAKGDLHVFVDECHRTQSGDLHRAMKALLPSALFMGFTGTPLLKVDKARSVEVFGRYIHTYKFDQAVREGVVLDLRYEAREIDQSLTSPKKIDKWFEAKTKGLTDIAKARLKQKWGTMQRVLSSQSRLEQIVADIVLDMNTKPRLMDGHGNAMLVAGSIYEACKFHELFSKTELNGKCAVVSSYTPSVDKAKGETTGEGETDNLLKYAVYRQMLGEWFNEPPDAAVNKVAKFEQEVKKRFIDEPARMRLLIVVDKLLTGFDAPAATYLYIDKQMRDHGLFQAICRVNRLDGDDKENGHIIDYKDLFKSLEGAVNDYTSGALDGFDKGDVDGLMHDRLGRGREDLEDAREAVKALCEPVAPARDSAAYFAYFCAKDSGDAGQLKDNEPKRQKLYKFVATLLRAYAVIAGELADAGYTDAEIKTIMREVDHYAKVRGEIELASGDYIDLKAYEPAMRHLIDTYIRADESEKISAFDDISLVQLLVERGPGAVDARPKGIRQSQQAVAETIENNVRRLIVNESPVDPAYYANMSKLLDALIAQRRKGVLGYRQYLDQAAALAKAASQPGGAPGAYPAGVSTPAQRALYNNLDRDEALALKVDAVVRESLQDGWRDNPLKTKKVRHGIRLVLAEVILADRGVAVQQPEAPPLAPSTNLDAETDRILDVVRHQSGY